MDISRSTLPKELHSFKNFLCVTFRALGLPDPNQRQYEIADWLQYGPDRQITTALRGIGKSWIASVFVMWCLAMDPRLNILVLSASKTRADDFSQFCFRLMELEHLSHLYPDKEQRQSTQQFDVKGATLAHAASVRSQGVTSQITGGRADIIIADDIEVPGNSWTAVMREKLAKLVTEFESILKPDSAVKRICYLGTPHTQESLYWHLRDNLGHHIRFWPAKYPEDITAYDGCLAPTIAEAVLRDPSLIGQATEPTRFDNEELDKREAGMGRSAFQLQFLLDTTLSDESKYPLKLRDSIVMDLNDKMGPDRVFYSSDPSRCDENLVMPGYKGDTWQRPMDLAGGYSDYENVTMTIDPSGKGSDECGYAVGGYLNGQIFILDWGGFLDGYCEETMHGLAAVANRFKATRIMPEENFGAGMWTRLFRPYVEKLGHTAQIEEVRHVGQKEVRMLDILEPAWQQHRLVFNRSRVVSEIRELELRDSPSGPGAYNLFNQATHLCKERGALHHDDRIEALSMLVNALGPMLGVTPQDARADQINAEYEKSLEDFCALHDAKGGGRKELTWLTQSR